MATFELGRVERLTKTYDLAALFPALTGPFTAATVALLAPRTTPTAAAVWSSVSVASGIATVEFAGPDADSTGAVVVPADIDLWIKATSGTQVDTVKVGRIYLQGGGAPLVVPGPSAVVSVNGKTGSAVVLGAADVGAPTSADLSAGLATKVNSSTYTAGLAAKQDTATLGAAVAADATVRAAYGPDAVAAQIPDPATPIGKAAVRTYVQPSQLPRPVRLLPSAFEVGGGGPVKSVIAGRMPAWTLRDANTDRVNAEFALPHGGTAFDIDVLWGNTSGSVAGNVVLRMFVSTQTVGDNATAITTLPVVTTPAQPGTYEMRRTRIASRFDFAGAMNPYLMFERIGTDAGDTLAVDIVFYGIIVTPVPAYDGVLTDDGGWCWFNEPRLIANSGKIYGGYVANDGSVGVSALTVSTGAVTSFTLRTRLEKDDHDAPGLIVMPDGRIKAFYSRHSIGEDPIYCRTTTNPGDITAWDAEQSIALPVGGQPCYPKPVRLGTRLYVFFRNALSQDYIYSDDNGATWSTPVALFSWSTGWRGYVNLVANGNRVDFICNDDNPNTTSPCNLYHCYIEGGNLKKTDGTVIAALGSGAITPAQMTKIYDNATDGDAWGWDIQLDASSRPVVVFATFPGGSTASTADTNHHYHYARWTGSAWVRTFLTGAGPAIIDRGSEYRYSGGIGLLSSDTSVVYLSRKIGTTWEIERWTTTDSGATWTSKPVTANSLDKQVRPTTPEGHLAGMPEVFWQAGWYVTFLHFGTRIVYQR